MNGVEECTDIIESLSSFEERFRHQNQALQILMKFQVKSGQSIFKKYPAIDTFQ